MAATTAMIALGPVPMVRMVYLPSLATAQGVPGMGVQGMLGLACLVPVSESGIARLSSSADDGQWLKSDQRAARLGSGQLWLGATVGVTSRELGLELGDEARDP
jgi:hypothetical protein